MEPLFGLMDDGFDTIVPESTFNPELSAEASIVDLSMFKDRSTIKDAAHNFLQWNTAGAYIKAGTKVATIPDVDLLLYPLKYFGVLHNSFIDERASRIREVCPSSKSYMGLYALNQMECCIGVKDIEQTVQHYLSHDGYSMRYIIKVVKPENVFITDLLV